MRGVYPYLHEHIEIDDFCSKRPKVMPHRLAPVFQGVILMHPNEALHRTTDAILKATDRMGTAGVKQN